MLARGLVLNVCVPLINVCPSVVPLYLLDVVMNLKFFPNQEHTTNYYLCCVKNSVFQIHHQMVCVQNVYDNKVNAWHAKGGNN